MISVLVKNQVNVGNIKCTTYADQLVLFLIYETSRDPQCLTMGRNEFIRDLLILVILFFLVFSQGALLKITRNNRWLRDGLRQCLSRTSFEPKAGKPTLRVTLHQTSFVLVFDPYISKSIEIVRAVSVITYINKQLV